MTCGGTWPGTPGYFVTEDGHKQMLMTEAGSFVICGTEPIEGGNGEFPILRGPVRDPAKLGIPKGLLDEAEDMTVTEIVRKLKAGQDVTLDVTALPAKLGIPKGLLDEAEDMTVTEIVRKLKAGQDVTLDVIGLTGRPDEF